MKQLKNAPNYSSLEYREEHILPLMKETNGRLKFLENQILKQKTILPEHLNELIRNHVEHMLLAMSYEQVVSYRLDDDKHPVPLDDYYAMHALFRSTPELFETYDYTESQKETHEKILRALDEYVERETHLIKALPFSHEEYYDGLVKVLEHLIKSNVLILSKVLNKNFRTDALPHLVTSVIEQLFVYTEMDNPYITSYAQYSLAFYDQSLKQQMLDAEIKEN